MVNIGDEAPGFALPDTGRKPWRLGTSSKGNIVIAFFPGAFTTVCTKEMCTFRDSLAKFNKLQAHIVGISVNDPFTNKAFAETNLLSFPLLSDYNREVTRMYGVELEDFAGLQGYSVAKRSVFILDRGGIIRYKWVSEDPGTEPNYQEIEAILNQMT